MARVRIVDVHELEPPRPMQVVLAELRTLGAGECLLMRHRREPVPLYAMLAELGFAHRTRAGRATAVEVVIWRAGDPEPEVPP